MTTSSRSTSDTVHVYGYMTRTTDRLLTAVTGNGEPAFLQPTIDCIDSDPAAARNLLEVDFVKFRVDPSNSQQFLEVLTSDGCRRRACMFVGIVPEDQFETLSLDDMMSQSIETFVQYLNRPATQRMYEHHFRAEYGGDLTPADDDRLPYLSDFLTIRDTMEVARSALAADPLRPIAVVDVLQDTAMGGYYRRRVQDDARLVFSIENLRN